MNGTYNAFLQLLRDVLTKSLPHLIECLPGAFRLRQRSVSHILGRDASLDEIVEFVNHVCLVFFRLQDYATKQNNELETANNSFLAKKKGLSKQIQIKSPKHKRFFQLKP
jgi:hypothetical protein